MYDPAPELGLWVRKQRTAKEQGTLSEERLQILLELGFEFGEEANVTEEWELRFDLLVDLLFMRVSLYTSAAHLCSCGISAIATLSIELQHHAMPSPLLYNHAL